MNNLNHQKKNSSPSTPIIYIDGVCLLCDHVANFIHQRCKSDNHFYFALLQEHTNIVKKINEQGELTSIIVTFKDKFYTKADAIIFIVKRLKQPYPLIAKLLRVIPKTILNGLYSLIARNRFRIFGRKNVCSISSNIAKEYFFNK